MPTQNTQPEQMPPSSNGSASTEADRDFFAKLERATSAIARTIAVLIASAGVITGGVEARQWSDQLQMEQQEAFVAAQRAREAIPSQLQMLGELAPLEYQISRLSYAQLTRVEKELRFYKALAERKDEHGSHADHLPVNQCVCVKKGQAAVLCGSECDASTRLDCERRFVGRECFAIDEEPQTPAATK
jgi:hypothetical protein